jgi:hypothetical protein
MKRLATIVAALALLLGLAVSPVAAAQGSCSFTSYSDAGYTSTAIHAGHSISSPTVTRTGAWATIDLSNTEYDICTPGGIGRGGILAWVGMELRSFDGDTTKVLKLGIAECRYIYGDGHDPCYGENNLRFFYAWGGCFPWTPDLHDLGPADTGVHDYAIAYGADDIWHFDIDGGTNEYDLPDAQVDCWTNSNKAAVYGFTVQDKGDEIGDSGSGLASWFKDVRYGLVNQGWLAPNWNTGACVQHIYSTCNIVNGDEFYAASTN